MNKQKITKLVLSKLSAWEKSQEGQTSGYEYEKTYVETMREIEQEVLSILTAEEGKS